MPVRFAAALAVLVAATPAPAEPDYAAWPPLVNPFESTGGGGVMIGGYAPQVIGTTCVTPFTATLPDGQVFHNIVEFEAVAVQGGILCRDGRWRARDGSASGTTPFEVFIKDGVVRRKP